MPRLYRVHIVEQLDPTWSAWLHNLHITHCEDHTAALIGPLENSQALYDVLAKLHQLGVTLIAVEPLEKAPIIDHW